MSIVSLEDFSHEKSASAKYGDIVIFWNNYRLWEVSCTVKEFENLFCIKDVTDLFSIFRYAWGIVWVGIFLRILQICKITPD